MGHGGRTRRVRPVWLQVRATGSQPHSATSGPSPLVQQAVSCGFPTRMGGVCPPKGVGRLLGPDRLSELPNLLQAEPLEPVGPVAIVGRWSRRTPALSTERLTTLASPFILASGGEREAVTTETAANVDGGNRYSRRPLSFRSSAASGSVPAIAPLTDRPTAGASAGGVDPPSSVALK